MSPLLPMLLLSVARSQPNDTRSRATPRSRLSALLLAIDDLTSSYGPQPHAECPPAVEADVSLRGLATLIERLRERGLAVGDILNTVNEALNKRTEETVQSFPGPSLNPSRDFPFVSPPFATSHRDTRPSNHHMTAYPGEIDHKETVGDYKHDYPRPLETHLHNGQDILRKHDDDRMMGDDGRWSPPNGDFHANSEAGLGDASFTGKSLQNDEPDIDIYRNKISIKNTRPASEVFNEELLSKENSRGAVLADKNTFDDSHESPVHSVEKANSEQSSISSRQRLRSLMLDNSRETNKQSNLAGEIVDPINRVTQRIERMESFLRSKDLAKLNIDSSQTNGNLPHSWHNKKYSGDRRNSDSDYKPKAVTDSDKSLIVFPEFHQNPPNGVWIMASLDHKLIYSSGVTLLPSMGVYKALYEAKVNSQDPVLYLSRQPFDFSLLHSATKGCYVVGSVNEHTGQDWWQIHVFNDQHKEVYTDECLPSSQKLVLRPGYVVVLSQGH